MCQIAGFAESERRPNMSILCGIWHSPDLLRASPPKVQRDDTEPMAPVRPLSSPHLPQPGSVRARGEPPARRGASIGIGSPAGFDLVVDPLLACLGEAVGASLADGVAAALVFVVGGVAAALVFVVGVT